MPEDYKLIISKIKEAVAVASKTPNHPEKKLRELVSPIWDEFLKEKDIGLTLHNRDELILANGRPDTVYNKLILEYKKPGVINSNNDKNRKLISQVQSYILDLAKQERFSKERLLGVAFDGNNFLFMKYSRRWIVDDPMPVNNKSIELFLKNLIKLVSKAALIPENLIRDFAVGRESKNDVAIDCVKAFYNEVKNHGYEGETKEHVFFEQWKIQFSEVHGTLEEKKIDNKVLFDSYGFTKKEQENFDEYAFFFSLDTYYALLMKLLSYQVVGYYTLSKLTGFPLHDWEREENENLKKKCSQLEDGGIFRSLGIRNFLEGDLFSWYIQSWNEDIYKALKQLINHLNDYDPETMEIAPDETRDILKRLYQNLVPKKIRHDLGEYYTPDWLAERCLNQLDYNGKPEIRILDPGCGSGTFLILAIKRAKIYAGKHQLSERETLKNILNNIYGFDLNPLAVISSRTNYLLAIAEFLPYKKNDITIPVYLCDSINPPQAITKDEKTLFPEKLPYTVKTSVGNFYFSQSIISKNRIRQIANIIEDCVKENLLTDDFLKKVKNDLKLSNDEYSESSDYLTDTYHRLIELEEKGINGIWARIIKNAFAPHFVGQFDIIIGNPPWINWDALPHEYRDKLIYLNQNVYGLFLVKGLRARHGTSETDVSTIMFYVSADKYLKDKGKLCFVITQSVFKTTAAEGFRQFKIKGSVPLKVIQVDDMVNLQPFENATNRTSVLFVQKGYETNYPLPYLEWTKKKGIKINFIDATLSEVNEATDRKILYAKPVNALVYTSQWICTKDKEYDIIKKILGPSFYKAHVGVHTGGANGVYWIEIEKQKNGNVIVNNLYNLAKRKVESVTMEIEDQFIFPLLRGREISKWRSQQTNYIILPQNLNDPKMAYDEELMKQNYPLTYGYFNKFKKDLGKRKSQVIRDLADSQAFYFIYSVKEYTFSPFKIVWKEVATSLQCTVISSLNNKPIIPDHKLTLISFDNEIEAHFVCAILNSTISSFIVKSYTISTQQSTHIMKNIRIPKYDDTNKIHLELSRLSKQCHEKVTAGIDIYDLEEHIDLLCLELWGISKENLDIIKKAY